jgi:hypothetical protein
MTHRLSLVEAPARYEMFQKEDGAVTTAVIP